MENQGYEEEQSRCEEHQHHHHPQQQQQQHQTAVFPLDLQGSFRSCSSTDTPRRFSTSRATNSDSHVYEDISSGTEDSSVPIHGLDRSYRPTVSPDQDDRDETRIQDVHSGHASRRTSTRSSLDVDGLSSTFQRNLTLPFRRGSVLEANSAGSSVRVTSREKNVFQEDPEACRRTLERTDSSSLREKSPEAHGAPATLEMHARMDCRPSRRRRKKDCKHCRSKAVVDSSSISREYANDGCVEREEMGQRRNGEDTMEETGSSLGPCRPEALLVPRNFGLLPGCRVPGRADAATQSANPSTAVFSISEKVQGEAPCAAKLLECGRNGGSARKCQKTEVKEEKGLNGQQEKSRKGMRVNSIYSQDRWYAKEAPIFFTDVKEHAAFQRAYSLPVRTQTPSSQNRVNLRRSVRGEPPPHPARLHKHRHGWTLHLSRPLEASGCTRSLVLLLIVILALLGVGAIALYIVFEPEKLQIIQQYLRSSTGNSTRDSLSGGLLPPVNDERNETSSTSGTLLVGVLLNGVTSFPESTSTTTEAETEATPQSDGNSTRYCDDCLPGEVCVALVDEEVPICRIGLDHQDPTGCAGFCLINKQKCHRLDVDAFRCVEVEHYCLDDEWTCSNTLCIPLEKHCDGHMNCYDHSDEYNCVCDLETHFQCGNETSCLPLDKRCDGKIDCWDAADEINCTLACPLENEFTCSNGQCILKARFCDGLPDCTDGSDEPHGCQGRCNKHEFTCQNSRCIVKGMKCNGIDDCGDGTDERHCKDRFP